MTSPQLPLAVQLPATADFETFVPGRNAEAVAAVRALAAGEETGVLCLHGAPGSGRTHLLQRCAAPTRRTARPCMSIWRAARTPPCSRGWNPCTSWPWTRSTGRPATPAGKEPFDRPPAAAGFALPDLATRLGWGAVYALHPLTDDAALVRALQRHAEVRGLALTAEVAGYLLRRERRDPASLLRLSRLHFPVWPRHWRTWPIPAVNQSRASAVSMAGIQRVGSPAQVSTTPWAAD